MVEIARARYHHLANRYARVEMHRFDPADLRAFLRRPWGEVRAEKERFWAEETRALGAAAGLRAGEALLLRARAVAPDWPTAADRARDYEHHLHLVDLLARAAHAFPRR